MPAPAPEPYRADIEYGSAASLPGQSPAGSACIVQRAGGWAVAALLVADLAQAGRWSKPTGGEPLGWVGERIDVDTGQWTQTRTHVGAHRLLLRIPVEVLQLFGDEDCRVMRETSIAALNRHVADGLDGAPWYGHVDMATSAASPAATRRSSRSFPACGAVGRHRPRG